MLRFKSKLLIRLSLPIIYSTNLFPDRSALGMSAAQFIFLFHLHISLLLSFLLLIDRLLFLLVFVSYHIYLLFFSYKHLHNWKSLAIANDFYSYSSLSLISKTYFSRAKIYLCPNLWKISQTGKFHKRFNEKDLNRSNIRQRRVKQRSYQKSSYT